LVPPSVSMLHAPSSVTEFQYFSFNKVRNSWRCLQNGNGIWSRCFQRNSSKSHSNQTIHVGLL
jgi:hypothetical protein